MSELKYSETQYYMLGNKSFSHLNQTPQEHPYENSAPPILHKILQLYTVTITYKSEFAQKSMSVFHFLVFMCCQKQ